MTGAQKSVWERLVSLLLLALLIAGAIAAFIGVVMLIRAALG